MNTVHELLSMRERAMRVRDLRREFGDAAIPKEMLSSLGFVYAESDDGVSTFTPIERLEHPDADDNETYTGRLPETRIRMELPTDEAVGVRITAAELRKRMVQFSEDMFDVGHTSRADDRSIAERIVERVYGPNSALSELRRDYPTLLEQDADGIGQREPGGRDFIALEYILDEMSASLGSRELGFDMYIREVSLAAYTGSRVGDELAHEILRSLQKIRGKLGDVEEVEHYFTEDLSLRFNVARTQYENDTPKDISHQAEFFAGILADAGFDQAAMQMHAARTLEEARQVIADTLRSNEHRDTAKRLEKDWQARRRQATRQDEIHRLSAERASNDDAYRQAMRTVRGLQELLDFPARYVSANLRSIKKMEEVLFTKASAAPIELVLDTKPDSKKDANPGEISGDCTEDQPLLFSKKSGMRNVKAHVNGEHIGNLYLLETDTTDGRAVWHIDAIQIPVRQIDWSVFPKYLIDSLGPIAEQAGVSGITINQTQYHISNYDYVSKGFMQYFGRGHDWKEHDTMEQPEDAAKLTDDRKRTCNVRFDRYQDAASGTNCSLPQGREDTQLYLWREPGAQTPD